MVSVRFTHLPLHTIAVDSMLEILLRNTYKYLEVGSWRLEVGELRLESVHYPKGKDDHRMAIATRKETVNQFLADQALPFWETVFIQTSNLKSQSSNHQSCISKR